MRDLSGMTEMLEIQVAWAYGFTKFLDFMLNVCAFLMLIIEFEKFILSDMVFDQSKVPQCFDTLGDTQSPLAAEHK